MQRDEVVRGDRSAGVVERPRVVGEPERLQAQEAGKLEAALARLLGFGRDRGEGSVELLRPSRACERLQGVEPEAALVRVERRERRAAADVSNIRSAPVP